MIVYNKMRKYAGHTIQIELHSTETIERVKERIQEVTEIPVGIQCITFGGIAFGMIKRH